MIDAWLSKEGKVRNKDSSRWHCPTHKDEDARGYGLTELWNLQNRCCNEEVYCYKGTLPSWSQWDKQDQKSCDLTILPFSCGERWGHLHIANVPDWKTKNSSWKGKEFGIGEGKESTNLRGKSNAKVLLWTVHNWHLVQGRKLNNTSTPRIEKDALDIM